MVLNLLCEILFSQVGFATLVIIALLYYLGTHNHDYFERRGLKFIKPVPFFGTFLRPALSRQDFYEYYKNCYNAYPDEGIIGTFEFLKPVYLIRDPDLAKQIFIKDFDDFRNHRITIDPNVDAIFGKNLFSSKDKYWQDMRRIISPAFTGSKMRFMFDIVNDCALRAMEYVKGVATNRAYEIDSKDFFTRITNDVIATAAFGVEINSVQAKNDFYLQAKYFADFGVRETSLFFLYSTMPELCKWIRMPVWAKDKTQFLVNVLKEAISFREKTGYVRRDMIHLLLEAKHKGRIADEEFDNDEQVPTTTAWTDEDIISQCMLFFIAGFETVSTLFVYLAYELMLNRQVQETLQAEIDEVLERIGDKKLTYEDIVGMKYMDMVISECLRKWPPNIAIDRLCNKEYTLKSGETSVTIKPGDQVIVPTIAFHHDPKYYPDPDKFIPERFSEQNRNDIHPSAYTPFGIGPRQCPGNRLALMEVKIFYFHILSRFNIEKTNKTEIPVQIRKGQLIVTPIRPLYLALSPRK